jgi:hypothetical protein
MTERPEEPPPRAAAAAHTGPCSDGPCDARPDPPADRATVLRLAREETRRWAELIDRLR